MNQKRIEYIDLAKGLCIALVVLVHVTFRLKIHSEFINILTTFLLPLFLFLTGLFFKEYDGFKGFISRKTNFLLIPFLFFYYTTSFILPNILYYGVGFSVAAKESLGISGAWAFITQEDFANNPIWYLWSAFLACLIFYICIKGVNKLTNSSSSRALTVLLMCCLLAVLNTAFMAGEFLKNGFLDTTFALMPFFGMGYITKQCTNILYAQKWDKWLPLIVIACLFITYLIGGRCSYMHDVYRISPLAQYIGGLTGTIGVIFLSKYLGTLPFVSYWGRYSLMILCTHALLLQIYVPIVRKIHLPVGAAVMALLVITMFSYQLLIPLMKKYLPYVTAQKDVIKINKNNI